MFLTRHRYRQRIGAGQRLLRAEMRDQRQRIGKGKADLACPDSHRGIISGHAVMRTVPHGTEGQTALTGFLDGLLHGERGNVRAHAVVTVDDKRTPAFRHDLRLRLAVDEALRGLCHVLLHARDAVGIGPPEICKEQIVRDLRGTFLRHAKREKSAHADLFVTIETDPLVIEFHCHMRTSP